MAKRRKLPESTAFISLIVASADINGLVKNCANLKSRPRLNFRSIYKYITEKERKVNITRKRHIPVQSLFKTIGVNIKEIIGVFRGCESICTTSMLFIHKISKMEMKIKPKARALTSTFILCPFVPSICINKKKGVKTQSKEVHLH